MARLALKSSLLFAGILATTAARGRTLEEILKTKTLHIATRNRVGIAQKKDDGNHRGFHYCLAQEFARSLDLKVVVHWQPYAFKHYFYKDGKLTDDAMTNPNVTYRPDVFKESDIAVDGFSALPWRRKLADFAPVVLARQVVIYNKTKIAKVSKPEDLEGKTVMVKAATVQFELIEQLKKSVKINVKLIEQSKNDVDGDDLAPLKEGKADFMLYPAIYSMTDVKNDANLGFGFPLGEAENSDWMVEKGNHELLNELSAFISKAEKSGAYDRCFTQEYGVKYNQYLRSVDVMRGD